MTPPEILEALRASTSPRRLSVSDYHRMIEAGIVEEDEHVELLEGVLVEMPPQSPPHAGLLTRLNQLFVRALPEEWTVRIQAPLTLSDFSEPEPDLAVVPAEAAVRLDSHPATAALVIEVARSTLRKDRQVKAALYARSHVDEYWIVNEADGCIEVFRDPDPAAGRYQASFVAHAGERLTPVAPGFPEVDVAALFRN